MKPLRKRGEVSFVMKMIIALLILVVASYLIYKFVLGGAQDIENLGQCQSQGGSCTTFNECTSGNSIVSKECGVGKVCCLPTGSGGT